MTLLKTLTLSSPRMSKATARPNAWRLSYPAVLIRKITRTYAAMWTSWHPSAIMRYLSTHPALGKALVTLVSIPRLTCNKRYKKSLNFSAISQPLLPVIAEVVVMLC